MITPNLQGVTDAELCDELRRRFAERGGRPDGESIIELTLPKAYVCVDFAELVCSGEAFKVTIAGASFDAKALAVETNSARWHDTVTVQLRLRLFAESRGGSP